MSKSFKRVALIILCAILAACSVAVGVIFGTNFKNNNGGLTADGGSESGGSNVSSTTGSLGADNKTDYVVSISGSATEKATQWKTAMGYNGSVTVILKDNWTANGGSFGSCTGNEVGFGSTGGLVIPSNKTVVLNMNGFNLNRGLSAATADGSVITVEANAELVINGSGNITGGYDSSYGSGINSLGNLTLNGATITGNKTSGYGGGVSVEGATFYFNSGTISNNYATAGCGGFLATAKASVIMTGGTVSGNTADSGCGGAELYDNSTMTMSGGTISGNTANGPGGGIGLYVNSTFNMSGGTISGNTGLSGGGVFVNTDSTFNMSGGEISGNTADSNYNGGGVSIGGTFNLSGGKISGNTCSGAGAVGVGSGTFTMSGGYIIDNPSCAYGVASASTTGFGVFNGGVISGNNIGVSLATNVKIGGPVKIINNTTSNLVLGSTSNFVQVTGALNVYDEACVGVTASNRVFTTGYGTYNGSVTNAYRFFFADSSSQVVQLNGSGTSAQLRLVAGTQQSATWSAVINGTQKTFSSGILTCYYGDVISKVIATVNGTDYDWTSSAGLTNLAATLDSWGPDASYTKIEEPVNYVFAIRPATASGVGNRMFVIAVRPRPITITIDDKTSKFGDSLDELTGSITSGTLANGDSLDDLGITYTKVAGDSVGNYPITATASNPNYDVTFVYGTYEITSQDVWVTINDQYATYGSKYYALTKTENNTPWAGVGDITNEDGQDYDSEGYPVDSDGDRINDNGDKLYNGGWRYTDGSPSNFTSSDLSSSTRYPFTIKCSGTGFTDITDTSNTAYIAVGKYFISYTASPNYNITFISNETNGAANTQGVFEIKGAAITVKSASVYDSENLYDSVDYDGKAHDIVIPAGAITLKGDITTATVKSVVFTSDDESIPEKTPKADDTTFWTTASTKPQKTDAGSYKVYSLISATNHETLVYVWTYKIGSSGAEFELIAKHGTTELEKDDSGAFKVTYDGVAVVVSIKFTTTGVTTTNCPVLIFYKGTNSGNTYGTAADDTYADESEDKDGNALGLGNKTAPKDAGTYQATVILDPSATSGYELDSSCDSTFTFTIDPKTINKPTAAFESGSGTYNGNTQTVNYTYDTAAVKITACSGLTDDDGNDYNDLTQGATTANSTTKTSSTKFTGKNAGTYAVKFDLTSTRNYKWNDEDNETGAQIVTCTVAKAKLDFTLVSPVRNDNNAEVWQWGAGTTAEKGITAKADSLTGLVSGDTVTFDVYWYKYDSKATTDPTLNLLSSGIAYDALDVAISNFTEQATYYLLIQVADGAEDNSNDNYCLSQDDTHFETKLVGVKTREIVVGAGDVDVSKIVWKWQLEGSGADPVAYVKNAENADENTKLVYTTKTVSGAITATNYIISADLSDLDYLEIDTSKGTDGYENYKYSAAGTYTLKLYIKIKDGSSYEFDTGDKDTYDADTTTTACVEFEWVINKKTISFTDDDGNSLVKWAYYLSTNNEPPAADATWTDFSDKNSPTYTGKLIYVKISDKFFTDLGISTSDVTVSYSSQSQAVVSSTPLTTKATVGLTGEAAKNYTLETKTATLEWKVGNTPITVSGWSGGDERTVDNGNGVTFTLPAVKIDADDEETAKKLAGFIEYKYTYTFVDGDGNTVIREDVDEQTMMDDLFVWLDESGQKLDISVKAVLSDEGAKSYDIKFDGADETIETEIGDSKMKVFVSLENSTSVYGDISFNLNAVYYFGNIMTGDPQVFPAEDLEVTINGTDTFALSAISNYTLYIKDAGEYKLTFKITSNTDVYKLGNTTLTFTVLPKPIAVPEITGEIVFAGKNIDLKEYLDANYAEYSDQEIVQWTSYDTDCYHVGTYNAVLTIVNFNYVWAEPENAEVATKSHVRYTVVDNSIAVGTDKINATYSWEIKPFVLDGASLWNTSGKEGASLNLPEWVVALMSGENPTLGIEYAYRTDKASPAVDPEWKGGNTYFVSATLNGADAQDFVFANETQTSEMVSYTVPQSGAAAFFNNVGSFVKNNWLWFVIGGAILLFLILLIIIIAVARKKKKKKAAEEEAKKEKEEAKAAAAAAGLPVAAMAGLSMADEKAKLEAEKAKMEAELAKAKMEAEAEAAKAKAQAELDLQKAKMEAELAKIRAEAEAQAKQAQQPAPQPAQQPVQQPQPQYQQQPQFIPQPQFMPQPQYMPQPQTDNGALARLEEEFKSMRAEQRSDTKLENEMLKLRLDMSRGMPNQYGYVQNNQLPAGQHPALSDGDVNSFAEKLGILMASMMRNMGVKAMPVPEKTEPQVIEAESQSGAVNTPTMYPPDAVITTTTTVDTTNRGKVVNGGDRVDDSIFDIDGFYDKFDESK